MKQLDVVNFALAKLGKAPVTGLDDEEVGAVLRAMWPSAVEYVVQEVKPVWAKRVAQLEGEEDLRLPGFVRSEALPEGCVDVVDVDVYKAAKAHNADIVIHGHTHKPASHELADIERWVIPDWDLDSGEGKDHWGYIRTVNGQRLQIIM